MGETSPTTSFANVVFAPKQTDVKARQAYACAAVRPGTSASPGRTVIPQRRDLFGRWSPTFGVNAMWWERREARQPMTSITFAATVYTAKLM